MLEFFRRYQRAFFLVITFFVVISFSFFGTFNAVSSMRSQSPTAFVAVDGASVSKIEVEEMVAFLSSDAEDKLQQGGVWGANFLNDGVVKKDLLETGIAAVLAEKCAPLFESDLQGRLQKEKHFQGYKHPKVPFISAETIWGYFAPEISTRLKQLQQQESEISPEAFKARIALYLAERQFPQTMLKQVLMYQQKQYSWLPPDEDMLRSDLSLFGYRTLTDWFGTRFMYLLAEFIINSAAQAEDWGYSVSKEEALLDLLNNASVSYRQNVDSPYLGVTNPTEYFKQQLQYLNIDQGRATSLWQKVLLFRRLYQNAGATPLVDRFAFQKFFGEFAGESVTGTLYQLPKALRLNDFKALQKFEMYLKSVARKTADPLMLPTNFYDVSQVAERNPELVQKKYVLNIASVDKNLFQGKVSVKEMWNWQVSDSGWKQLKEEFPELSLKEASQPDERRIVLDQLDKTTKKKVDQFARKQIVNQHLEWIAEALENAPQSKQEVSISLRGGSTPFVDLKDNAALISLLDAAPLAKTDEQEQTDEARAAQERLNAFSADNTHYYRIQVLQKPEAAEILTFAEANERGLLNSLTEAALKGYYLLIREKSEDKYKRPDGRWKSFEEVRSDIANEYFGITLKNIRDDALKSGLLAEHSEFLTEDRAASLRLYKYVRSIYEQVQKDPSLIQNFIREEKEGSVETTLADQWKLERQPFQEKRSSNQGDVNVAEAFNLPLHSWSKVETPVNGALTFFYVDSKGPATDDKSVQEKVLEGHTLLSHEAQRKLAEEMIAEMLEEEAITLSFLDKIKEPVESSAPVYTFDEE